MCTGKCSRFVAVSLYPLVLLSIICNIILFFPGWDVKYVKSGHITEEVKYMGGLIGGGFLMFLSIIFAAVGVAGAAYSFCVALLGLANGPFCSNNFKWTTPFKDSHETYLTHPNLWSKCKEPPNVVQFHIGLFITLMIASTLQGVLCASQMINGLIGCLCGMCYNKEEI